LSSRRAWRIRHESTSATSGEGSSFMNEPGVFAKEQSCVKAQFVGVDPSCK
jgi:hypothetical protein